MIESRYRITDDESMRRTGEHLHYDHIWPWSLSGPTAELHPSTKSGRSSFKPGLYLAQGK
jgi:hypothetical protein